MQHKIVYFFFQSLLKKIKSVLKTSTRMLPILNVAGVRFQQWNVRDTITNVVLYFFSLLRHGASSNASQARGF